MSPLLTWVWPETLIEILVVVVIAVLTHALVLVVIRRTTDLALRRSRQHASGSLGRAGRILNQASGLASHRAAQRTRTLGSLLRSVSRMVITTVAVLTVLTVLGIPLTPFLASAGVGGIAVAFGAQSLIKDYLSGIFLIIEDQYGVGDILTVNDITGTVEEVSLRVTRLRDLSGKVWYIRHGEITTVGNLSQGYSTGLVDIPVAYDSDAAAAIAVLNRVVEAVDEDPTWSESLLEPATVLGVESISGGTMTLRIRVKSPANQQYGVMREIRERAQAELTRAGIRGPVLPFTDPQPAA